MYRDGTVPLLVPCAGRPRGAQSVDIAAVLLQATAAQVAEEIGVDSGECLHACSVESEDVVGADERDAEQSVFGVLDAAGGRVGDAGGKAAASLAGGEVRGGGVPVAGEGGEPRGGCACKDSLEPSSDGTERSFDRPRARADRERPALSASCDQRAGGMTGACCSPDDGTPPMSRPARPRCPGRPARPSGIGGTRWQLGGGWEWR